MELHRIELTHVVDISASASDVYKLVADVRRMAELSPEVTDVQWSRGVEGTVGARFVGTNQVGTSVWKMECEVLVTQPASCFAWTVLSEAIDHETSVWRFDLEPAGPDGQSTLCRQTFRMKQPPTGLQAILDMRTPSHQQLTIDIRRQRLDAGMHATLQRLKAVAETEVNEAAIAQAARDH